MTKPDKIDLIVQLFLAQWVLGTLETPFPAFGKISIAAHIKRRKTTQLGFAPSFNNFIALHLYVLYICIFDICGEDSRYTLSNNIAFSLNLKVLSHEGSILHPKMAK